MIFDDEGASKMDENISQLIRKITSLIRASEDKLKAMQESGLQSLKGAKDEEGREVGSGGESAKA
jgi:hypothetical protein